MKKDCQDRLNACKDNGKDKDKDKDVYLENTTIEKYACQICKYETHIKKYWQQHTRGKKHREKQLQQQREYICRVCHYDTKNKKYWQQHTRGKKHKECAIDIECVEQYKVEKDNSGKMKIIGFVEIIQFKNTNDTLDMCQYNTIKYIAKEHVILERNNTINIKIKPSIQNNGVIEQVRQVQPIPTSSQQHQEKTTSYDIQNILDLIKSQSTILRTIVKEKNDTSNNQQNTHNLQKIEEFMIKQSEIQQRLMEIQENTQKQIQEISKTPTVIVNNKTIHNTFNMNNFLNISCKDAPNFKDFVLSLQVGRPELEFLQENGYVKSFENFVIRQLQSMEQTKRPLHCLDQKRKKFIVKHDNAWSKDDVEKRVRYSIDHFCTLLLQEYTRWKDENPQWKENDDELNDIGLYLSNEIFSPYNTKKNEKIEAKVYTYLSNLIIDKNNE